MSDMDPLYQLMQSSAQDMSAASVTQKTMITADDNTDVNIPGYGLKPSYSKQIKNLVIASSKPYATLPDAQAAVTAGLIKEGQTVNVISPDNRYIYNVYKVVGGALVDTGKREADGQLVQALQLLAEDTDGRTRGILTVNETNGRIQWVDPEGFCAMELDENGKLISNVELQAQVGEIVKQLLFGTDFLQPMPADSPFAWAFGDLNYNSGLAGRKAPDNRVEYFGVPMTNIRGVLPGNAFHIGDSLTANGTDPSYAPCLNDRSWPAWASMFSDGAYRYVGQSATGGYTSAQVLSQHLPNALASGAYFVSVLVGRNDVVQGINVDTVTIPNLKSMFDQIRFNGQVPIICSMAAQRNTADDSTRRVAENKINDYMQSYALKYGCPYVDMRKPTVDPATGLWIPGYSFDDISHPAGPGAKAMGKYLAQIMKDWIAPNLSRRPFSNTTPALSLNKMNNPILLNATGNVPDNWTVKANLGTITVESGGSDFIGNKLKMVSPDDGNIPVLFQTFDVTAGKHYAGTFKLKITAGVTSTSVSCYFLVGTDTSTTYFGGLRTFTVETDGAIRFNFEGDIPAGATQVTIVVTNRNCVLETGEYGFFELNNTSI